MLGVCDVERKRDALATRGSNARRPVYPSPASAPAGCCHRTSIAHRPSRTSMIFSTPLLRTLEFGMSAFTAGLSTEGRSRTGQRWPGGSG